MSLSAPAALSAHLSLTQTTLSIVSSTLISSPPLLSALLLLVSTPSLPSFSASSFYALQLHHLWLCHCSHHLHHLQLHHSVCINPIFSKFTPCPLSSLAPSLCPHSPHQILLYHCIPFPFITSSSLTVAITPHHLQLHHCLHHCYYLDLITSPPSLVVHCSVPIPPSAWSIPLSLVPLSAFIPSLCPSISITSVPHLPIHS